MTEIIENAAGEPFLFIAERDELQEAIAAIPDDVLLYANERQWLSRGLEPPERSATELRQRLLEKHEQAARRLPDERVLPVEEAARHLELTGRVLHYRIQRGHFSDAVRDLPGGRVGLAFKLPAKPWSLVVERPDPRVLMRMAEARVQPGEELEWQMLGEERVRSYRRLQSGENWQEAW
jgi:hypothetical protein